MLIDGHNDLAWAMRQLFKYDSDKIDLSQRTSQLKTDIPRLQKGGVTAQFWSVYAPSTLSSSEAAITTIEQIQFVRNFVERFSEKLVFATSAQGIVDAHKNGQIASLVGLEGGHCIDESLTILQIMHALGARYMTLTHNQNHSWADSATDVTNLGGLSSFGFEVVREMNRLGMMVDLSHVSDAVMRQAIHTSTAPVIFSHSAARSLVDVPRNVPDDVLEMMAKNGGLCMVAFVSDFVSSDFASWFAKQNNENTDSLMPLVTAEHVADHIDHIREVAGIDHVGIGADFDGSTHMPSNLKDVSCYPVLLATLKDRGWSNTDLKSLCSGNILRVLRGAEDVAASS